MGAINYGNSEYITLGYDLSEFTGTEEEYIDMNMSQDTIDNIINDVYLGYFSISLKYGNYEGFYLNIDGPFGIEHYYDKFEAHKEVEIIKDLLVKCAQCGMVACFPGWSTGYSDIKETMELIQVARDEMHQAVQSEKIYRTI